MPWYELVTSDIVFQLLVFFAAVSHSLHKQGITSCLQFFTSVFTACAPANRNSFAKLLSFYAFEDREKEEFLKQFAAIKTPYTFLELEVDKRTFKKHQYSYIPEDDGGKGRKRMSHSAQARDRLVQEKANRFLGVLSNSSQALALFDLLYARLEKRQVNPETLEITLAKKGNSSEHVKISLIQYVAVLVDTKKEVHASPEILKFHSYLGTIGVNLPSVFVLNKDFV